MGLKDYLNTRAARRLRARRVRRLVRHVEPWSVLKVALIFFTCAWVILLFVGVTLWNLAVSSGLVANVENFVTELGALESFKIHGDQIFRIATVGGLVLVVAFTGLTVLAAVLFNIISDITGGVRFTVVEEETARPRVRRARQRVLVAAPSPPTSEYAPVPHAQPGTTPVPTLAAAGASESPTRPGTASPSAAPSNPSVSAGVSASDPASGVSADPSRPSADGSASNPSLRVRSDRSASDSAVSSGVSPSDSAGGASAWRRLLPKKFA